MKRFLSYSLSALIAVGLLFSCGNEQSKQDDPAPVVSNPIQNDTIQNPLAKIEGSWHLLSSREVHVDSSGNVVGTPITKTFLRDQWVSVFTSLAAFTLVTYGNTSISGTYQVKQDSLITSFNASQVTIRDKIDSLTTTRLVYHRTVNIAMNSISVVTYKFSR